MSTDGIGTYPIHEPSPMRLEPSWDEEQGYGEDMEPDAMVKLLETFQKPLRVDSDGYQGLERIKEYIETQYENECVRREAERMADRTIAELREVEHG